MSAHRLPQRRTWLSALVAKAGDYVFETIEEPLETEPVALEPHPVIAVVSAAPGSGASTVARLLAAELAVRADGAAVFASSLPSSGRPAPPLRAAIRLATALGPALQARACGRLCVVGSGRDVANAARYLAPVVLDLPADGSAAGVAAIADRVAVLASPRTEPALLDAVAAVVGGDPVKVVNRMPAEATWGGRADHELPDSRIAARAAALGTRALGPLGAGIAALADSLAGES